MDEEKHIRGGKRPNGFYGGEGREKITPHKFRLPYNRVGGKSTKNEKGRDTPASRQKITFSYFLMILSSLVSQFNDCTLRPNKLRP